MCTLRWHHTRSYARSVGACARFLLGRTRGVGVSERSQLPALNIADYEFTKFGKFIRATDLFDIDERIPRKGKPPVVYLRPKTPA